jgi:hypothetical protein
LLPFRNAASFGEEDEDGSLRQEGDIHEHDEAVKSADRVGHTDPRLTAKAQLLDRGKETGKEYHVHSLADLCSEKPNTEPGKQEEFERPDSEFDSMAMAIEMLNLPLTRQRLHA